MKKIQLDSSIRMIKDENYKTLAALEKEIADRIRAEFSEEMTTLRKQNKKFQEEERIFRRDVMKFISTLDTKTQLRIVTQVGPSSTVLQTYVGNLEYVPRYDAGVFNFISLDKYQGKPFTVGTSCLQSIEVID